MKIDLSIIIVNWNTKEITLDCLRSVFEQTKNLSFEVILVDNGSSDGSLTAIRRGFPSVRLIENRENLGFAKASNQGIKNSRGKYILLLNSDTVILKKALDKMVGFMERNAEVGACSARLVGTDRKTQHIAARFPSLFHYFNEYILGRPSANYPREKYGRNMEVEALIGACLMLRKEVISQVGLLSENYFMYSEDVDLCYRIRKAGWKIMYLAEPEVVHLGGESSKKVKREMDRKLWESRLIFFGKFHSSWEVFALRCIIALGLLRKNLKRLVS